jgi:predicted RNA methylase
MCGGGSTVQAALVLGNRKVIACDIDLENAVIPTQRLVATMFGVKTD